MKQSMDISDFSNLFASLQGNIARSKISTAMKTSGTENNQDSFKSLFKDLAMGKSVRAKAGSALTQISVENDQAIESSGKKVIESLKKALIGRGISNFETSGLDMEGLSKLENLLLKSGADPDKVSSLISSLKERMKGGTVSLKEVFAGLNNLEDEDFFKDDFFLEVSAAPYLESLMTSMGLDAETVRGIMESSTDTEKGLNVGKLVNALKSFDKSTFKGASLFIGDKKGDESAADILEQIGIKTDKNDKNGRMSLGRLISILEKNAAEQTAGGFSSPSSSAVKDSFTKVMDAVKTGAVQADPAGTSRAMFAKMQLSQDKKTAEIASEDPKTKNDKFSLAKNMKNSQANQTKKIQEDVAAEDTKTKTSAESIFESRQKGVQNTKTAKTEDRLESSARIFEMIQGREKTVSETKSSDQAQRPLPVYVANQAAKGIMRAISSNDKEITIQIKPAELGRMQIKIENSETGIKVQIVAEKNSATELLNSSKSDLTAMLAESGIKVNKLDIQLSFNFDQAMSSMHDQAHQESGKKRNRKNGNDETGDSGDSSGNLENNEIEDRVSLTA